jgi:hypothetical protein
VSRSKPVQPYRVIRDDTIIPETKGWTLSVNDGPPRVIQHGDPLEGWDAQLQFSLERVFRVQRDLSDELRLESGDPRFEFVVCAATAGGLARQVLFRQQIDGPSEVHVRLAPDSTRLARDIHITSGIYLQRDVETADPLAPTRAGSRLWELNESIRLEGGAARLPMYVVSFARAFAGDRMDHAEFHVEISEEPDLEVESSLIVYLNADKPHFIEQINIEGGEAERRLWNGIMRRVLTSAVLLQMTADYDPTAPATIASTVVRWATQIWPTIPPSRLRDLPEANFSRMEAQIESWLVAVGKPETNGGRK